VLCWWSSCSLPLWPINRSQSRGAFVSCLCVSGTANCRLLGRLHCVCVCVCGSSTSPSHTSTGQSISSWTHSLSYVNSSGYIPIVHVDYICYTLSCYFSYSWGDVLLYIFSSEEDTG
jgi:hypothetical protein